MGRLGVVVAMPSELAPLRRFVRDRPDVEAVVAGIGTARAAAAAEALLDGAPVDAVYVIGICGGVDVPVGSLVVPEVVIHGATGTEHRPAPLRTQPAAGALWTSDTLTTGTDLDWLRARGIVGVDMETAAVAAVCEARGAAWSTIRAVSDPVGPGGSDVEVLGLTRPDGSPDLGAVARYVGHRPRRVAFLARLAAGAKQAARAAAAALEAELGG